MRPNPVAIDEAITRVDKANKSVWAVEVYGTRFRLILENSKKIAQNEEFIKLLLAFEALKKKYSQSNEVLELMQIDIDTKEKIIADFIQKLQNAHEENRFLK